MNIDGVRNLSEQRLVLAPAANLFYGANGSGKTSILEAIALLATGKSFRTHSARPLIQHQAQYCLVQGRLIRAGQQHNLGIRRHRSGDAEMRIDGSAAQSLADLAQLLPTVLLDTNALELISGPPELRRRYLDGTVFHVEQFFLDQWRRYQRALRQRNAGLRRGTIGPDNVWLDELARAGELLTTTRSTVVATLAESYSRIGSELSPALEDTCLSLRCGWDADLGLREALDKSRESDRNQGYTHVGPHRADLKVTINGRPAADVMSRGQMKLAVVAMKLAQGELLREQGSAPPIYLVDDIAAELDRDHAGKVCELLAASGSQVLLTSVSSEEIRDLWPGDHLEMFHVEQGVVTGFLPEG